MADDGLANGRWLLRYAAVLVLPAHFIQRVVACGGRVRGGAMEELVVSLTPTPIGLLKGSSMLVLSTNTFL